MKDFILLFHSVPDFSFQPTPEQIQAEVNKWQGWIGGIAAQGKLKSTEGLGYEGKTLAADGTVTDGPYLKVKEMIGGFLICSTETIDEAIELAKGCPVFENGGQVEVRDLMVFEQ